jgi:hypothetical protein
MTHPFNLDPLCYNLETGELLSIEECHSKCVEELQKAGVDEDTISSFALDDSVSYMVSCFHNITQNLEV